MNDLPLNQILCGDCLNLIYDLPPKSVDLILTDPPYNIVDSSKLTKIGDTILSNKEAWGSTFQDNRTEEDYAIFMGELCNAFDHVLKKTGSIIMFFDRSKPYFLRPFYERFTFRNMIVFVKNNPLPHFRKNNYRSSFEQSAWFSRDTYNINFISQRKMTNVFRGNIGQSETEHPTEKYEWMISPLIERHSQVDEIVLDPMCGSGTTLLCAKKLRRNFIGIDIESKWCDVSRSRVSNLPTNLEIFGEMKMSEFSVVVPPIRRQEK